MAEEIIGQELYPATYSEGRLSASCDGLTLLGEIAFEHKQWSATLADAVRAGNLPVEHQPQCQQVMMVTGADRLLFMVSDGTSKQCVYVWVEPDTEWRKNIVQGWTQFSIDLDAYMPEAKTVAPVAAPQMALPSVTIQVQGSIALIDNLDVFGAALTAYVVRINTKPETDQDFADLEAAVKTLKTAEEALDAAENGALAQAVSIDTMRRAVAQYRDLARTNRLLVEKIVKAEKENRRAALMNDAIATLEQHYIGLNARVGMMVPRAPAMFADAVKGLKSLDSMKDKLAAAVANAKIAANELADRMDANIKSLALFAPGLDFLFADKAALIQMDNEPFSAIVVNRVRAHNDAQAEIAEAKKAADEKRIADAVAEGIRVEGEKIARDAQQDAHRLAVMGIAHRPAAEVKPDAVPDHIARAGNMAGSDAIIDDYLKLKGLAPSGKSALRLELMAFVRFQTAYKCTQPEKETV